MSRYLTTIPYLASWPTEEHHNNVQDHGKPVKHKKFKKSLKELFLVQNRKHCSDNIKFLDIQVELRRTSPQKQVHL